LNSPWLTGVTSASRFMLRDKFLHRLVALIFSGIQNFPTIGLIDGTFRANLEETGMGYALEVDLVRHAHALDLLTTPYVFDEQQAQQVAAAGADIVVCHLALTTGGTIGAGTVRALEDCVAAIQAQAAAAAAAKADVLVQ